MTADNLTFSLEIDFIPDIQEGRMDLKAKMKEVAANMPAHMSLIRRHARLFPDFPRKTWKTPSRI